MRKREARSESRAASRWRTVSVSSGHAGSGPDTSGCVKESTTATRLSSA